MKQNSITKMQYEECGSEYLKEHNLGNQIYGPRI